MKRSFAEVDIDVDALRRLYSRCIDVMNIASSLE